MLNADRRAERAAALRQNVRGLLELQGWSIRDLCERTGLGRGVVQRWVRQGADRVSTENLTKLARLFEIDPPGQLFNPLLLKQPRARGISPFEETTNPCVAEVADRQPELFVRFTAAEWKELYSHRGTGGSLTPEGVVRAAERINAKRSLRQKFDALLETHHFSTMEAVVSALYRETELRLPPVSRKGEQEEGRKKAER